MMVGQKLQLEEHQQENRADHQADQSDQPKQRTDGAVAHLSRAGKKLHEDVARQLSPEIGSGVAMDDLMA